LPDGSVAKHPLFNLRFHNRADSGKTVDYSALDAKKVTRNKVRNTIRIDFGEFEKGNMQAGVTLDVSDDNPQIQVFCI
jgi:hypothetical protein